MPGLFKHPDGSVSRVAVPYDGTQMSATVRQADGTDVPVIDFHTRSGERGQTVLASGIEILALDVSGSGQWSFNGNSGVIGAKRNWVPPGGPVVNPSLGWTADTANGGTKAVISNNGANIRVANAAANYGCATKSFSTVKNQKYIFSVTFQNGGVPGTSYFLRLGTAKYGIQYVDDSQVSGVASPVTRSFTFTATGTTLYVAMGNQLDSAGNVSIWSVPTLVKG